MSAESTFGMIKFGHVSSLHCHARMTHLGGPCGFGVAVAVRVVVEACLDFYGGESVSVFDEQKTLVRKGLVESLGVVGSLLDASRLGSKMREGLGVVLLGPPNCGKSTLLSALAQEDVAIVSDAPGTTRDLL